MGPNLPIDDYPKLSRSMCLMLVEFKAVWAICCYLITKHYTAYACSLLEKGGIKNSIITTDSRVFPFIGGVLARACSRDLQTRSLIGRLT